MTFTQHCLDRFIERSGIKDPQSAAVKLSNILSRARHNEDDRYISGGWEIRVGNHIAHTIYKKPTKEERAKWWAAHPDGMVD